jgi:hypothetical protein
MEHCALTEGASNGSDNDRVDPQDSLVSGDAIGGG